MTNRKQGEYVHLPLEEQAAWVAAGKDPHGPKAPYVMYEVTRLLKRLQLKYEAGEQFALMGALWICGLHETLIPRWAAEAFEKGYFKLARYEVRTLDEAFGARVPKGAQLRALSARERWGRTILDDVMTRRAAGQPIDDRMFEEIGEVIGMKPGTIKDIYVRFKRENPDLVEYYEVKKWFAGPNSEKSKSSQQY